MLHVSLSVVGVQRSKIRSFKVGGTARCCGVSRSALVFVFSVTDDMAKESCKDQTNWSVFVSSRAAKCFHTQVTGGAAVASRTNVP